MQAKLRAALPTIKGFPKQGVDFVDIAPLFYDPFLVRQVVDFFVQQIRNENYQADYVGAPDARGFLLGPMIAAELQVPFIMLRKPGKMPNASFNVDYEKEYGVDPDTGLVINKAKFDAKYGKGAADAWNAQHQNMD